MTQLLSFLEVLLEFLGKAEQWLSFIHKAQAAAKRSPKPRNGQLCLLEGHVRVLRQPNKNGRSKKKYK